MYYFYIYFLAHIISDFVLQTESFARKKDEEILYIVLHGLIVFITTLIITIFMNELNMKFLIISVVIGISHLIIDGLKHILIKADVKNINRHQGVMFIIDQIIHILIIIILVANYMDTTDSILTDYTVLRWIILLILIWKPCNISFKKLFGDYKPNDITEYNSFSDFPDNGDVNTIYLALDENIKYNYHNNSYIIAKGNTGALIGVLERLSIVICIYFQVYTAVGLIIAAKSIARYDKISKNPLFSEYYLLGTLYSLLFAVLSFIVCFGIN